MGWNEPVLLFKSFSVKRENQQNLKWFKQNNIACKFFELMLLIIVIIRILSPWKFCLA